MAIAQDPEAADDLALRQQSTEPIGLFAQVATLCKKNFVLKYRNAPSTLGEIVIPVVAILLLMFLRGLITVKTLDHGAIDTPARTFWYGNESSVAVLRELAGTDAQIVVLPRNNDLADTVAANLKTLLPQAQDRISRMDSDADLEALIADSGYGSIAEKRRVLAAVHIENSAGDQYRYTIRMNATDQAVPFHPQSYTNELTVQNSSEQFLTYLGRGFVFFQTVVEHAIVNGTLRAGTTPDRFVAQMFPQPQFTSDAFATVAGALIPLLIVFGYIYTVTRVSKSLMEEKEEKIAEGLKIIGVSDTALFLSWLIVYVVVFAVQSALITIISMAKLFPNSNALLVFLLFFLFPLSGVFALAYLMTPLFVRQRVASTVTALVFLISTFVFFAVSGDGARRGDKLGSSLIASNAFCHGLVEIFQFESNGRGVTFGNSSAQLDFFSYADAIGFMLLDFVVYVVIGAYLTKVVPSTFGVALPWNFFLQKSYWFPHAPDSVALSASYPLRKDALGRDVYDRPKTDQTVSVSIRKLRCEFNNGETVAVNDLSLDMYRGEIFCLLGHNGAGKTTTISMLSGFLRPSSGDAMVFGNRITTEMDLVRKSLGYCPQHDCLYPQLTVKEHLLMFGRLKGIPERSLQSAVTEVIETVGLTEKVDFASRSLSGGQKRKLSIGMALIGDSKLILLDEPTSGGPGGRRTRSAAIRSHRAREQEWTRIRAARPGT